jgi:hypothetical protein
MDLSLPISRLRSFSLLGALLAVGCSSADERTGAAGEAVDLAAIPAHQAAIVQDGSGASKATGAVFIPFLDSNHAPTFVSSTQYGNLPVRGSCGVTFVSPHYAITSSHCFADANAWDPANQTFTTMSFDVTQANVDDFYFDAAMQGTFPNYTPIFGHTMTQAAGYTSTSLTCKIASRCAYLPAGASAYNCDGIAASDVTMLHCSTRPAHAAWLPIANDSATTGAVTMYWFHELFMTNNNPDMITHYTDFTSHPSNWHYLAAPTNAFLPFKSVPWSGGVQRARFGGGGDNDVKTDLYGCHGTSGSGVLVPNGSTYALLGPVHNGGSWAGGHLCDDPNALTQGAPNGHGLTYNSNVSVNNLVNAKYSSALRSDRAACSVSGTVDCCGDGVCRSAAVCRKLICP